MNDKRKFYTNMIWASMFMLDEELHPYKDLPKVKTREEFLNKTIAQPFTETKYVPPKAKKDKRSRKARKKSK